MSVKLKATCKSKFQLALHAFVFLYCMCHTSMGPVCALGFEHAWTLSTQQFDRLVHRSMVVIPGIQCRECFGAAFDPAIDVISWFAFA